MLAGLQAGILAGICTAVWLSVEGARTGHSLWSALNLISTAILGRSALVSSFGLVTVAGFSIHMVVAGMHGLLFGALLPTRTRPLLAANAGVLFAFGCYAISFGWIVPHFARIFAARSSRAEWLGAHFLFGLMLGLYPDFARSFLRSHPPAAGPPIELAPEAVPEPASESQVEAAPAPVIEPHDAPGAPGN